MEWDTLEHAYQEKSKDWYAAVTIVGLALIVLAFFLGNILMAFLILIGGATFLLLAARQPQTVHVNITHTGIRIGQTLYPYNTLDAFALEEHPFGNKILLESTKSFMHLVVVPIAQNIQLTELHRVLAEHLPEKEISESLGHIIFERLGF